jgi:hypothetical protein
VLCMRLDFRAKKNGILAPTQYGFRKGRGTRDCLALLTTDISTSFEMKRQTVVALLNISGAYDNVLIDVLCGVMLEKELPLGIVRFMLNMLCCKTLFFYVGGAECMNLTGYKHLPQSSVLSPFLGHRVAISFNMLMTLWCTRHTTYFKLLGLPISSLDPDW